MIYRVFLSIGIILFLSSIVFQPSNSSEALPGSTNTCDLNYSSCTKTLSDCQVTLDITPKPIRAMKDLTFTVVLSGKNPATEPSIDLGMPGMKMGPNRVMLRLVKEGTYQGEGVVVKCPSGKKTWQALVIVSSLGSVEFVFDVLG
jgi:hypothetical protein